jgi:hypothetical protein
VNSPASDACPPRLASWLVSLFALDNQAEPIEGDLLEEFSSIESRENSIAARRWYWKQSLKSAARLAWTSFRTAPGLISATTIGAFLFLWATQWLPVHLVFGLLERYSDFFDVHFGLWWFGVHYGGAVVGWTVAILLGCLIGFLARGREIVATATFGVFRIIGAPIPTIALLWAFRALFPHDHFMSWNTQYIGVVVMRGINFAEAYRQGYGRIGLLFLYLIQPFASVLPPILGGLVVRKVRQSAARTPVAA